MFKWILLSFITIPLIELYMIVQIGLGIGIIPTIAICVVTAIVGANLAKKQGVTVLKQLQEELSYGYNPTESLLDGTCILVGGIMLLFPGFFTDFIGFMLLVPFFRKGIKKIVRHQLEKRVLNGTVVYRQRKDITDEE